MSLSPINPTTVMNIATKIIIKISSIHILKFLNNFIILVSLPNYFIHQNSSTTYVLL